MPCEILLLAAALILLFFDGTAVGLTAVTVHETCTARCTYHGT